MKKKLNDMLENPTLTSDVPFAIREAFNQLRTNLMYTITDDIDGAPVFAITSSSENTGKSMVITNLAISFSQLEKKVLLIDADLRCPVIHDYFGFDDKQQGLSDYISGLSKDVVIRDVRPNLDLITSGRIPPNPSELLSSPRFTACLNAWKKEYDIIFIDFPPVGIVTDPITVSAHLNGFIFVAMANRSNSTRVNNAINSIKAVDGNVTGIVVNATNSKDTGKYGSGRYGYRYSYRYSYQYGYRSDEE